MSLARHMLRVLAVMIVTIVAGLGASAAQAHDGHARRHAAPVHSVASAMSMAAAKAVLKAEAGAHDACVACGRTCTACCHSVLMPATATDLPSPTRTVRVAASAAPMPPGLAPEALPRPPRAFA